MAKEAKQLDTLFHDTLKDIYFAESLVHAPLGRHGAAGSSPKPDRSRIDLSDEGISKQWVKKLGKTKEEIATAIAKVGDNAETVRKELRNRSDG